MKGTETIKIEQPFEGDGNRIYYVNGGRCSGKVNKTINELVDYINNLQQENRKQKEIIDKVIDFIKNGDLLYLANKNSIVYRNNIEIRAVADRLNDLLQILEYKEVSE